MSRVEDAMRRGDGEIGKPWRMSPGAPDGPAVVLDVAQLQRGRAVLVGPDGVAAKDVVEMLVEVGIDAQIAAVV